MTMNGPVNICSMIIILMVAYKGGIATRFTAGERCGGRRIVQALGMPGSITEWVEKVEHSIARALPREERSRITLDVISRKSSMVVGIDSRTVSSAPTGHCSDAVAQSITYARAAVQDYAKQCGAGTCSHKRLAGAHEEPKEDPRDISSRCLGPPGIPSGPSWVLRQSVKPSLRRSLFFFFGFVRNPACTRSCCICETHEIF